MLTRRSLLAFGIGVWMCGLPGSSSIAMSGGDVPDTSKEFLISATYRKQLVPYFEGEHRGMIVVDPENYFLYQVRSDGYAIRYGVGVGREGFSWRGKAAIMRKESWPDWRPPAAMRKRQPYLPSMMPGGKKNPLGARALYLYEDGVDTLYRIHGTMEPETIGTQVSSGCIRMLNEHIVDLYSRIPTGTKVLVK